MIELKPNQINHFENICSSLEDVGASIDASPTGSGKTFVALVVAVKYDLPVCIVAPKSVCQNWQTLVEKQTNLKIAFIGTYHKIVNQQPTFTHPIMVICDEFHMLKNDSNRSKCVKNMIFQLPKQSYVMFLSATIYDKEYCEKNIECLFKNGANKTAHFKDHIHEMNFIQNRVIINSQYLDLNKRVEKYNSGVLMLNQAVAKARRENACSEIVIKMLSRGTQLTHSSLTDAVLKLVLLKLCEVNRKVIIVGKFHAELDVFEKCLSHEGVLRMDGSSNNRQALINKFQTPNNKFRVFITSAQVGGVGVDLDDQHGEYPRTMIIMPSYDGTDLIQCFGRVNRANTKSTAEITMVYGNDAFTNPVKKSLERKVRLLGKSSKFIRDIDLDGEYKIPRKYYCIYRCCHHCNHLKSNLVPVMLESLLYRKMKEMKNEKKNEN